MQEPTDFNTERRSHRRNEKEHFFRSLRWLRCSLFEIRELDGLNELTDRTPEEILRREPAFPGEQQPSSETLVGLRPGDEI